MSRIFGKVGQVAYVTRDLGKSLAFFVQALGIGPWFVKERAAVSGLTYRGQPTNVEFSFALANTGDLQIEIIQQLNDGPSVYRDFMSKVRDDLDVQHIAFRCPNYVAAKADAVERGFGIVQDGQGPAGAFCYVAHPDATLFCIEISELTPRKEQLFAFIAQTSVDWDGTNPFRTFG